MTPKAAAAAASRGWLNSLVDRLLGWHASLPPEQNNYTTQTITLPLDGDGDDDVQLAADLYQPLPSKHGEAPAAVGTLLVQSPYGRGAPLSIFLARVWAARGYNVLFVSSRGTFGSGSRDQFDPAARDQRDGMRVVRWMRRQPWYTGSFATFGMSYLGYTQFALMDNDDPFDDYAAAVIAVAPHDFADALWGTGALWLPLVDWAAKQAVQESLNPLRAAYEMLTESPLGAVAPKRAVPLLDGVRAHLVGAEEGAKGAKGGKGAEGSTQKTHTTFDWVRKWVTASREDVLQEKEGADDDDDDTGAPEWARRSTWAPMRHGRVLETTRVPILLLGGWQDIWTGATFEQYERIRARGGTVALTVGPWNHMQVTSGEGVMREAWDWVEKHLTRRATGEIRPAPVRIDFSDSPGETRWLSSWPPGDTRPLELYLDSDGALARDRPGTTDQTQFTFDPHDPTPTYGGPLLFNGGYVDDSALARRADVLSFTTAPLDRDVEVVGRPRVELRHGSDNPHVDLFVRLCEVSDKGVSRNLCQVYRRLDPERHQSGKPVTIELDTSECAHRFRKGTSIRLIVAGGNFPHYSYNLGSGERQGTGTTLRPATHTIHTGGGSGSKLVLPVS